MGHKYKQPPILEALFEMKFIPAQPWDMTIPGLIYEEVKSEYSDKKQKIGLDLKFETTRQGVEHKVEPAPPRMQFHRPDGTGLIQVAPDMLVINQLKPYPSWPKFKPRIRKLLKSYIKIAKPKGFSRIGLRFINKINIESKEIGLGEYFNMYIHLPKELPKVYSAYLARLEIPCSKGRDLMVILMGTVGPEKPSTVSIILDIDYFTSGPDQVTFEQFDNWIEEAHRATETAFEACITDKCRELFGEVQ